MLNMKGMLAKLFSAVLALGMVIQPVTPLTSPIIVFAEGEGGTTETPTAPEPSSPSTPGAPEPDQGGNGNQTPGENEDETTGNTGTGNEGGQTGGSGGSDVGEPPLLNLPDSKGHYLHIAEDANNKGLFTISLVYPSETGIEFPTDYFFSNYDVNLTADVLVKNSDGSPNNELSKTDASVAFVYNAETKTATADVNSLTNGLSGYYVTISGLDVTYTPKAGLEVDPYEVNVFGDDGKSAITSWKNNYDFREVSVEISDYDKEKKTYTAKVNNPKIGVQYTLQLVADGTTVAKSEPVYSASVASSITLTLNYLTYDKYPGTYSVGVFEGTTSLDGKKDNVSFDYTAPQLTNLSVVSVDENTDKVVAEFDEEMDASSLKLVLNYANNVARSSGTVEVNGFAREEEVGYKYSASLANLDNENSETTTGTKYTFYSLTGFDASVNNNELVYAEGYDPSNAFVNYVVDDKAPIVTDIQWSDNVNNNVETNQKVTATVTFSEPLAGDPELLYTVDGSDYSNPNKIKGTFNAEEGNYTFTFAGSKDENKPAGEKYSVIGFNATDSENNSNHDEKADDKVSKEFIIDMVAPTVSANFVYPLAENTYSDSEGIIYYNSSVNVEIVANEEISGQLNYIKGDSDLSVTTDITSVEPTYSEGKYIYQFEIDCDNLTTVEYSNFDIVELKDKVGNSDEEKVNEGEITNVSFVIDHKAPVISSVQSSVSDDDTAVKEITYTYRVSDDNGSGLKLHSAEFSVTNNGQPASVAMKGDEYLDPEDPTITVYEVIMTDVLAGSVINAKFYDNLGNVSEDNKTITQIVEDTEPELSINAQDTLVYSKEHSVTFDAKDENGSVNSGIDSITYNLYAADGFDETNIESNEVVNSGVLRDEELVTSITLNADKNNTPLNGTYYLYAYTTDLCGNESDYKNVTLNFDNTAPVISDINAQSAETYLNDQNVQFTVTDTLAGINEITVTLLKDGQPVEFTVVDDTDAVVSDSQESYPITDLRGINQYIANLKIDGAADGLDGAYDLQISATDKSAVDGNVTTGEEIKKVTLNFDNTAPILEDLSEVENERHDKYAQSKTVKYTVTDEFAGVKTITFKMVDSAEKPVDKFTVVDAEGNVLLDSQDTYTVTVDEANKLNATGTFTIDAAADDLNGDFTLRMTAIDHATNEVAADAVEEKLLTLYFDNTAPSIDLFEENNDDSRAEKYDQSQTVDYAVSDTYAGVKTVRFELYQVNKSDDGSVTLTPAVFRVAGTTKSDKFYEIPVSEENIEEARSVDGSLTIDGSADNLNGEYVLRMITTDWAENVDTADEIKEVKLFFDNTPMQITVNYISDAGAYEENVEGVTNLYYNQPVEVEVTLEDNFAINGDAEDYDGFQFTTTNSDPEGDRNVVAKSESYGLETTSFTTSFTFDPQDNKGYYETLKNWYSLNTRDGADNGSIVTVNYLTATGEKKTTTTDEVYSFVPTNRIIVDMVNPTYVIDLGTSGISYNDADDVVNKEYFGSSVAGSLKPTVTFTEGNFADNAYQVATVSDTTGDTQYENVTIDSIPDAEWHSIGESADGAYSIILTEDLDSMNMLPDGVYRFAVRGTDKAGNALVQSSAEERKTGANATSMVTDGTYWTGYKIVDTKVGMNFNIRHSLDSDAYYSYQNNVVRGTQPSVSPTFTNLFWSELTAYISVSPDTDIKEMSETEISFKVNSSARQYEQSYTFDNVAQGITLESAQQKFDVYDVVVTDRAGNSIEFDMRDGDDVYLDVDSPEVDLTGPTVNVTATTDITARAADGRPLFNGPVTIQIEVEDPNGEISSGLSKVTIDPSVVETNNITLNVKAVDKAGNKTTDNQLGTTQYNFGIDVTAPVVEISFDNNSAQHDKYFKENRVATVKVTDRNINTSLIQVHTSVAHSGFSAIQNGGGNGANDYRTFTIPYTEDGDYTLNITGTDALGNRFDRVIFVDGTVAGSEFTIDKTTPVINVSFNNNDVRNGKYYNAARVATVTIDEHNFLADEVTIDQTASIQRGTVGVPSPSGFGTSGDSHSATINYSADGNYTLTVSYTDMAGNEAEQVVVPEFTIDTTKPVVRFDENTVTDNMATNDVIAPSVIFDDTNFDANGISVSLKGARVDNHNHPFTRTITQFGSVVTFSDFARVKESDDIYTAKATITDLAGNTAEATVRFSVNRFGSTFDFNDDEPTIDLVDSYYAQETGNVIIREVNVNKLTGYTLTVNRDGSNITLVEGEDFRVISSAIAGGYQYIYEIFPEVFTSEGTYSIIVQSVDEAGNTNTNSTVRTDDGVNDYPVVFAIDKTLPTVSIDELDPDDRSNNNFNENSKTFRISVRDNNAMSRVIVTVDGNVVFDMEGQELAEYLEEHGGFVEITLDASSGYQTIKVQAFDGAGNESADTQYQVLVTTNFFVRFFYNKPLFYGSIIFLILLLLAIAYYIKKKMDKQKKNA